MRALDQFRYGIAVFLLAVAPAQVLFWLVVHPFARFWRRIGYRWGYAAGLTLSVFGAAAALQLRGWAARTDLGSHVITTALGVAALAVAIAMRRQWQRQLSGATMLGLPELAPSRYPGRLLTDGIYARVRHPRYLQIVVAVLGWALLANHLASYLVLLVIIGELAVVIPLEERELADRFGAEYDAYRRRVPALFPRWRASAK